jgi:hypothetical protein
MEAKSDRPAKCQVRLHRLETRLPVTSLMLPDLFPAIVAALIPTCVESLQKWRGFNYTDFEDFKTPGLTTRWCVALQGPVLRWFTLIVFIYCLWKP